MQTGLKVNVYLVADSSGKTDETHIVQTLQINLRISESFPFPDSRLPSLGVYSALQRDLETSLHPSTPALAGNKPWGNQSIRDHLFETS